MNWFEQWFDSQYYHILYKNRDSKEAAFFIDNILNIITVKKNQTFLDLACGTGRHAVYLNKKGFRVKGIDLSKQSLMQAKKYENETLRFELQDMRRFSFKEKYDVVLNLFTSFGYFENNDDNQQVFQNVEKVLKKNGYFIIDFLNVHKVANNLQVNEKKIVENIEFNIKRTHDKKFIYKHISIIDAENSYSFTEKVRMIQKKEFISYSKNSSMKLLHTFGDYALNKYNSESSNRLIMIFQKI